MTPKMIDEFRSLHREGCFVMPNPHDVGTAKLLQAKGFPALATTSSGFAASIGKLDMTVDRDTLVSHVTQVASSVEIPLNVDSERCFSEDLDGIRETVRLLSAAGAAGFSIEDWNPISAEIDPLDRAALRVGAAASAASDSGMVLTARCEHLLHGVDDLDATIERLLAYRTAGAEVVYAPGLASLGDVRRVVSSVGVPLNVLLLPGGPTIEELAAAGVRRISTGGLLARAAYGAVASAADSVLSNGNVDPSLRLLDRKVATEAFG
jgi:2-methylisocitrate lyase-like PEP mutase family enzyme